MQCDNTKIYLTSRDTTLCTSINHKLLEVIEARKCRFIDDPLVRKKPGAVAYDPSFSNTIRTSEFVSYDWLVVEICTECYAEFVVFSLSYLEVCCC